MELKETREKYGLSQIDAATMIDIPVRTYRRYENDNEYGDSFKRKAFIDALVDKCEITEEKGLLSIKNIKDIVTSLFDDEYKDKIDFCYLFGSYSKGTANEKSDVDLYVSSKLQGLEFVGLIERLSQSLHKKVDVIRSSELNNNIDLVNEVMKYGIKIYG